jgi:hypothetical protein
VIFRYETIISPTSCGILSHLKHQATDARITPEWNLCQIWKIHLFNHDTHIVLLSATSTARRIGQGGRGEGGGDSEEEMHDNKN